VPCCYIVCFVVNLPQSVYKVVKNYILDKAGIDLRLQRMALEIAEQNMDEQRIVIASILPNGAIMSDIIKKELAKYFDGVIEELTVDLDKRHPGEISLSNQPDLNGAVLLLLDDVANSGKTLTYALKPFLEHHPNKIQTAVLVARTHRKFPIQPDIVGFSLATTLQDYIDVEVADGVMTGAWIA
jgi:pyrimidine operon attenuation protein / uracil phosphoribosyltransferase